LRQSNPDCRFDQDQAFSGQPCNVKRFGRL
jgi:hypothetical protein